MLIRMSVGIDRWVEGQGISTPPSQLPIKLVALALLFLVLRYATFHAAK